MEIITDIKQASGYHRSRLSRHMVFVGRTGAGKSAIPDAVEFGLSGTVANVYGRALVSDRNLLMSLAPPTEPNRVFVDLKLDDGTMLHRELTRIDGAVKQPAPTIRPPMKLVEAHVLPLRRVTEAMLSGAVNRRLFVFSLLLKYLTDEQKEAAGRLTTNRLVDGSVDLSSLSEEETAASADVRKYNKLINDMQEELNSTVETLAAREGQLQEAFTRQGQHAVLAAELAQVEAKLLALRAPRAQLERATQAAQPLFKETNCTTTICPTCGNKQYRVLGPDVAAAEQKLVQAFEAVAETMSVPGETGVPLHVQDELLELRRRDLKFRVTELERLSGAVAEFTRQRDALVARLAEFAEVVKTKQARVAELRAFLQSVIKSAADQLCAEISSYLPGLVVGLDLDGGKTDLSFGLVQDGYFCPTLSEGQTKLLQAAVAMTLPIRSPFATITVEADLDAETLSDYMAATVKWPGYLFLTATKMPANQVDGWEVREVRRAGQGGGAGGGTEKGGPPLGEMLG